MVAAVKSDLNLIMMLFLASVSSTPGWRRTFTSSNQGVDLTDVVQLMQATSTLALQKHRPPYLELRQRRHDQRQSLGVPVGSCHTSTYTPEAS